MKKCLLACLVFVAGFSPAQQLSCEWAKSLSNVGSWNNGNFIIEGICADSSENVYISGYYRATEDIFIDTFHTLFSNNYGNFFLAKLNRSGKVIWVKSGGGNLYDAGTSVALDVEGNVILTGHVTGNNPIAFDNLTLNMPPNTSSMFVAKYRANGKIVWVKNAQLAVNGNTGMYITTDANSNIFVTGTFNDSIGFGDSILTYDGVGPWNIYMAKYDASGNALWGVCPKTKGEILPVGICADINGAVYLTGQVDKAEAIFGNDTIKPVSKKDVTSFIVKYDGSGTLQWVKSASKTYQYSIAMSGRNYIYSTGFFKDTMILFDTIVLKSSVNNNAYILKMDTNGTVVWSRLLQNCLTPYLINSDQNDNSYLTGTLDSAVAILDADHLLTRKGKTDAFILKYDSAGNVLWTDNIGAGSVGTVGYAIYADKTGNIYGTGFFNRDTVVYADNCYAAAGSFSSFVIKYIHDNNNSIYQPAIESSAVAIYPNPSTWQLFIEANNFQPQLISIYDLNGRKLSEEKFNRQINVSGLTSGIYFIEIKGGDVAVRKKFVKL